MDKFEDATELLAERSGVYMLYLDETLVYVGKSRHVPGRVMEHKREKRLRFNRITVCWCKGADMDGLEFRMIRAMQPSHNIVNVGPNVTKIDLSRFDKYRPFKRRL